MTFEPLDVAVGRFVVGRMTNGYPAIFSIESLVGLDGFMGRQLCGSSGTVSKAGYIPWAGVTVHETRFTAENARDLLPGAIEDAGGGLSAKIASHVAKHGSLDNATIVLSAPTPEPDTKWDRDARAALTGLLLGWERGDFPDLAAMAAEAADALAAERAGRGEVG
jgi:hypothetical protein